MNKISKDVVQLKKRFTLLERQLNDISRNISNIETLTLNNTRSLNQTERDHKIIVSMTSFPARINFVDIVLHRLFLQTLRPDKVVLYLSKEQFPNLEKDLPYPLLDMKEIGLEIHWCDGDIKAYKKLLPALKEYENDIVIIVDDDLIYDVDLVENLYRGYLEYPNALIASRVHKPTLDGNKLEPYQNWIKEYHGDMYKPSYDLFLTGGAGTLIPPHIFDDEVFNMKVIQECCPHADDIWINIQAAIKQIPIVNIAKNNIINRVQESQIVQLFDINRNENDTQLNKLREYYKEQLKDTIYK